MLKGTAKKIVLIDLIFIANPIADKATNFRETESCGRKCLTSCQRKMGGIDLGGQNNFRNVT